MKLASYRSLQSTSVQPGAKDLVLHEGSCHFKCLPHFLLISAHVPKLRIKRAYLCSLQSHSESAERFELEEEEKTLRQEMVVLI